MEGEQADLFIVWQAIEVLLVELKPFTGSQNVELQRPREMLSLRQVELLTAVEKKERCACCR